MNEPIHNWHVGQLVQVSLPHGTDSTTVLPATVTEILTSGPADHPNRTIKVRFGDPMVYGGKGVAWVNPVVLSEPGAVPATPEREA